MYFKLGKQMFNFHKQFKNAITYTPFCFKSEVRLDFRFNQMYAIFKTGYGI